MQRRKNGEKGKGLDLKQVNKAVEEYNEMECGGGGELDELTPCPPPAGGET